MRTKRGITLCVLIPFVSVLLHAQIKVSANIDGFWGEWEYAGVSSLYGGIDYSFPYAKIYGDYSGFCIYPSMEHPSNYCFKFQISNYTVPDKKTRKTHQKSNNWYEYSGVVEYYVNDELPTIGDILKRGSFFGRIPSIQRNYPGAKKRTANAIIRISPYKDHPQIYNIWFDDVGVAIDLCSVYF